MCRGASVIIVRVLGILVRIVLRRRRGLVIIVGLRGECFVLSFWWLGGWSADLWCF